MDSEQRVPPTGQGISQMSSSSSYNIESERDYYKEKVEHFKLLIKKLQEEVQAHKIKKEGTATMSKLLQESKLEVAALQKKNKAHESIIRNLQSRLEKNGLPNDVTLLEGEEYLPGHSKCLLDNLTRENTRLRNLIRNNTGDPEEIVKLQQQLSEKDATIDAQHSRITELEGCINGSEDEKDRRIANLQSELAAVSAELNTRNAECVTMADETLKLQKQLKDVAEQCQHLAKMLKGQGHSKVEHIEVPVQDTVKKVSETPVKAGDVRDGGPDPLAEQNKVLQQRLQEVTTMNKRWQEYHKERQNHIKMLETQLSELRAKEASQVQSEIMVQEVQEQMNKVLDEARRDVDKAHGERDKMRKDLKAALTQIKLLTDQIKKLEQNRQVISKTDSAAETIEALKAQIQICTEDFECERRDREKAQTRMGRMEEEMEQLKKENDSLKRERIHWQQSSHRQQTYVDPFYHYQMPHPNNSMSNEGLACRGPSQRQEVTAVQPNIPPTSRSINNYNVIDGKQVQSDGVTSSPKGSATVDPEPTKVVKIDTKLIDDHCASLRTSSISSNSNRDSVSPGCSPRNSSGRLSPINSDMADDILICHKCKKEFTSGTQDALLEHLETCL